MSHGHELKGEMWVGEGMQDIGEKGRGKMGQL